MSATALEATMPKPKGRPRKPGGPGKPVRIDADLVSKARYIAAHEGADLSELISRLARPAIEREFRKLGREFMEDET